MSQFKPRRGLIVPGTFKRDRGDPGPRSLDPTVTFDALPTIGVTCPRPSSETDAGPEACENGGKQLEVKFTRAISDTIARRGYYCPSCGYESTLDLQLPEKGLIV